MQTFKNPNSRIVRWLLALQDFSFEIFYRSGKENVVADALSRLDNSNNAQVNAVTSDIPQFDLTQILKNIQSHQESDPFCANII